MKKVYKVAKEVCDMFNRNKACLDACEKVVHDAIQHYELASIESQAMWREIGIKLGLDHESTIYEFNYLTHEIIEVRKISKDTEMEKELKRLDKKLAIMKRVRDEIEKALSS